MNTEERLKQIQDRARETPHYFTADFHFLLSLLDSQVAMSRASVAAPEGDVRRLTLPELNHLSALLAAERESGEYAGPREQYYARTEGLIKWCDDQIGGK